MNNLVEPLRAALMAINAHRARSVLTGLGIMIGVASVITVVSLIQGLSQMISDQFEGLGSNAVSVHAKNDFKDVLRGKTNALRFDDVEQLITRVNGIREISPIFSPGGTDVRSGNQAAFASVFATTPSYQKVQRRYTILGRFIAHSDEKNARRVAVIGVNLIKKLHLQDDPTGQFLQFYNEWFMIIGVMEPRGEIFGISQDDYMIIPYKTGRSIIGNNKQPNMTINISFADMNRADDVKRQIFAVLRAAHRLKLQDKDDFEVVAADQLAKSFADLSNTVTIVMGSIVGIALLVGGVGIMNIMLVSVTERTREIGLCKAIGARAKDILLQFLIEAVILSLLGGVVGLVFGYILGWSISNMIPGFPAAVVPWWAVFVSLIFCVGIGIIFGVVPASKAAKLDPIEALRYE